MILIVKSILITLRKLPRCIHLLFCCTKFVGLLFALYLLFKVFTFKLDVRFLATYLDLFQIYP